jgi:4-oxalocrotonate tautomerase
MPHVIVKLWPGPSERQKQRLAGQIVENVVGTLKSAEAS